MEEPPIPDVSYEDDAPQILETGWKPLLLVLAVLVLGIGGCMAWVRDTLPAEIDRELPDVAVSSCNANAEGTVVTASLARSSSDGLVLAQVDRVRVRVGVSDVSGTELGAQWFELVDQERVVTIALDSPVTNVTCQVLDVRAQF